ncbi:MAG TPA: hypothetical protein VGA22_04360 [Gemmatimonadales bacterium]|jgi:hypothetical protein
MVTKRSSDTNLRTPWDTILGTKSHVRILRVLEQTRESMAVREVARRAGEHLRAAQLAVERLVEVGVVKRVGTGLQQQVRLNEENPLTPALAQLFEAERTRFDRLLSRLRSLAKKHAKAATAVWLREGVGEDSAGIEVGLLASSGQIDTLTDAFREAVTRVTSDEDVSIDVRGWTKPDLEAMEARAFSESGNLVMLQGTLPDRLKGVGTGTGRRSHAAVDETLRDRAKRVAEALQRRPELVRRARDEVTNRLVTASPPEAKTLREWLQLLDGMSVPRLQHWLVGRSERATRLRQSMPLVFLQAASEQATPRRSKS